MLYFSRWKTISIWAVVLLGVLFTIPNMLSQSQPDSLPGWFPKRSLTLGLDLPGRSHILLAIDRQDLVDERLQATRDDIRTMLRDAKIGYTGLTGTGNTIQVRITDPAEVEAAKTALASLIAPVSVSYTHLDVYKRQLNRIPRADAAGRTVQDAPRDPAKH